MSQALERVIAEQQNEIDHLKDEVKRGHETLNGMWTTHEELFLALARLIDFGMPHPDKDFDYKAYASLRHEARMQMLDAGYCMTCYNFVCECDGQYD